MMMKKMCENQLLFVTKLIFYSETKNPIAFLSSESGQCFFGLAYKNVFPAALY